MVPQRTARRSAIAFDIGAAGIRACQFRRRRRHIRLCDALQVDRLPTADADKPAAPAIDPRQLRRLVGQGDFGGRDVALVLSPPEVQFIPVQLPEQALAQPAERVAQALKWEAAQASRMAPEELEVRYWRLPPARGQAPSVMVAALPATLAVQWFNDLAAQGLTLRRIDVSPCALVRLAVELWDRSETGPSDNDLWGVLDIGLRRTALTVVVGVTPVYIRSLSVGARQWTRQLADALDVPWTAAEQLKREHGVRTTDRGLAPGTPGRNPLQASDLPSALSSILRESLQMLAQEAGRCFSYVLQSFPDAGVKRLLLAGGGASLGGLAAFLETELGVPTAPLAAGEFDNVPWQQSSPALRLPPHAAAALGAALLDLETP